MRPWTLLLTFVFVCSSLVGSPFVAAQDEPLKVFVLAGQSNMQGHAQVRTLGVMAMDPNTAPILEDLMDENGEPRVLDEVWISSLGSAKEIKTGKLTVGYGAEGRGPKIGPELTFGLYMQEHLDQPILIIKTAWGGKSINTDFRPPSAGPYEFNEQQIERFEKQEKDLAEMKAERAKATGVYYRQMIEHVKSVLGDIQSVYPEYDPEQGYELSGFVWFQGWNDMVDSGTYPNRGDSGGYDQYSEVLAHFIRDVRNDLSAPELPFVIGVMGVNGPTRLYDARQQRYQGVHQNFRDAMAAPASMPEFEKNVTAVLTENFWDMELTKLRSRDAEIRNEINQLKKSQEMTRAEEQEKLAEMRSNAFTPEELHLLENGASNAEYHYMGSGKIMAQIGKGFAEAMAELLEE